MKLKTLFDVKTQEATDFIKLPYFLDALEHSPLTRGFVNYDAFFMLLDKGLPLRFSEPGCCFDDEKIPNGDVKCALLKIGDALFETDISRTKLFAHEIIRTEAGNDIPLVGILIGREDVRRICANMGLNEYPWVKIPWPDTASDFYDFPVRDNKSEQSSVLQEHQKAAAEIKAGRSPGNSSIEDLLEDSIVELLDEISPEDDYDRYFHLYAWKRECEAELLRVNTAPYADEARREDRISSIRSKIREIETHLDASQKPTQTYAAVRTKAMGENNDSEIVDSDPVPASFKQENQRKRGPTKITVFLTSLCQQMEDVTAEKLVRAIRPLVGNSNCPVKKYHGFYDEVCVEWKPGSGSPKGTWGKKAFQNFVGEFRKKGGPKGCQD